MNRIENYFVETNTGFSEVSYKRAFLKDVLPYIGGQWKIFTRLCCEFICNSGEAKKFEDFYQVNYEKLHDQQKIKVLQVVI